MRIPAVVGPALVLGLVLAGCSGDEDLPWADELHEIDTSPDRQLVLGTGGSTAISIATGEVLAVRNEDDVDHRLVGDGFDTGTLRPGDETLVVWEEPADIAWTDRLSDLAGTIEVFLPGRA